MRNKNYRNVLAVGEEDSGIFNIQNMINRSGDDLFCSHVCLDVYSAIENIKNSSRVDEDGEYNLYDVAYLHSLAIPLGKFDREISSASEKYSGLDHALGGPSRSGGLYLVESLRGAGLDVVIGLSGENDWQIYRAKKMGAITVGSLHYKEIMRTLGRKLSK